MNRIDLLGLPTPKPSRTFKANWPGKGIVTRRTASPRPIELVMQKFWDRVEKTGWCWNWTASCSTGGYGVVGVNGRRMATHRFSWAIHFGKIPDGLLVCHRCDNPKCVRPDHLFLGTSGDNAWDMSRKGRGGKCFGSLHPYSKLTEDQVVGIWEMRKAGARRKSIAAHFGVTEAAIKAILAGRNWKRLHQKYASDV